MRLWSKHLIEALPNRQLKGQWRECCAIAKGIHDNGTPGHLLVNKIMDYPISHFCAYTKMIDAEMDRRGIGHRAGAFTQYFDLSDLIEKVGFDEMFKDWHDFNYMFICTTNLYEKFLCGGLTFDEMLAIWNKGEEVYKEAGIE